MGRRAGGGMIALGKLWNYYSSDVAGESKTAPYSSDVAGESNTAPEKLPPLPFEAESCARCGLENSISRCGGCKRVAYCSRWWLTRATHVTTYMYLPLVAKDAMARGIVRAWLEIIHSCSCVFRMQVVRVLRFKKSLALELATRSKSLCTFCLSWVSQIFKKNFKMHKDKPLYVEILTFKSSKRVTYFK